MEDDSICVHPHAGACAYEYTPLPTSCITEVTSKLIHSALLEGLSLSLLEIIIEFPTYEKTGGMAIVTFKLRLLSCCTRFTTFAERYDDFKNAYFVL